MKRIYKILYWAIMVGLSGALVRPVESLLYYIPWSDIFDSNRWKWLIEPSISIFSILIDLIVLLIVILISRKIIRKFNSSREERLFKELKQFNNLICEQYKIKVTWDVGMGSLFNNDPFPYNIRMFCLNHGSHPLQLMHGHCSAPNCPNNQYHFDENILKNEIESRLLQRWEKLKQKSNG